MSLTERLSDDGTYIIGPFGRWPFKYRVRISDYVDVDRKDEDWVISIQRYRVAGSDWATIHWTRLYNNGAEYVNRLKKP